MPLNPPKVPFWLYGCILVAAALSLLSLSRRYTVEQANKDVAICVEMDTVSAMAAAEGKTLDRALGDLKLQGVSAVVLSEEYAGELVSIGRISLEKGRYISGEPAAVQRVIRGLKIRYSRLPVSFIGSSEDRTIVEFPDITLVRGVSIGLNPVQAEAARQAGMLVIARCSNPSSGSANTVVDTIAWANELGASVFMPQGDQVLGQKAELDTLADTLSKRHMFYASPEFVKIAGDDMIVKLGSDPEKKTSFVLRLHSAQTQELDKMAESEAVDRFARATRERNQRLLLLRPLTSTSGSPLTDFGAYVKEVGDELGRQGGHLGPPQPFSDSDVPAWLICAIAISVVPVSIWTFSVLFRKLGWRILVAVLLIALAAACLKHVGRPYMAIVAALTFPTAGFFILDGRRGKSWLLEYVLISIVSLTGGLCVAGMLNGLPYFVRAEQFEGVKFAHFFPIVVVGLYFFWRFTAVKETLDSPMRWGKALLSMVILAAMVLMITRTGNDNPAAVSGAELKLRAILDQLLMVRPRTKEFFFGHPLLVLGIGMLISNRKGRTQFEDWKGWMALFLTLGAVGQTSIVNTMCHFHTPLTISLARIGVGLVAGGIIGAILLGVVKRLHRGTEL